MIEMGLFSAGLINSQPQSNQILDALFSIVPKAEELGFKRFWIGEHYALDAAWRNPEIILTILAGITSTIRIGSAGVLLNLHAPLLVAQNYKLLEYLFSGRIDLGIAKGGATEQVMKAFGQSNIPFEMKVAELIELIEKNDLTQKITIPPYYMGGPQVWFLGRSSFNLAIEYHANVCLSLFHKSNSPLTKVEITDFRSRYFERWNHEPNLIIGVAGICLNSRERVNRILETVQNNFIEPTIVGNERDCFERIMELKNKFEVKEIVFMDLCFELEEKIECYTLLSQLFNLNNNGHPETHNQS
jgi:alkanesulfonate monooxygenase SsuD/methylene tetrahydromethanopterin reductase-like flavin-dependent oxidoreductase (luciferase family)